MVNDSACAPAIRAKLCGAGASPRATAEKSRVVVEICAGVEAPIVREKDFVTVALRLSVTRMTNVKVPVPCGAPLNTPVDALSVSPRGRAPESTVHLRGAVAPEAASVTEELPPPEGLASGEAAWIARDDSTSDRAVVVAGRHVA